ncbi:hypothetical protein C8J56DRAFT_972110 [Mycena floridula]|nr:hypothetical protein C8J56DRAFT_972110 [Mycena floridula]
MGHREEFEATLKELVQAKRLSASKMSKLTEIALKSMHDDTHLVSILYRTHKTLPTAAKVSSLYAFDALARAARQQVNKHGLTGSLSSEPGNAATFLLKLQGVLEGLFQDMITTGTPEAKEKTKKILDIWGKGNTFPLSTLTRLAQVLDGEKDPETKPADPRTQLVTPVTTPPAPTLAAAPAPTSAAAPTAPAPPTPLAGAHSALLALLTKAVSTTPGLPNPTPGTPQADAASLAILQQLKQSAKLGNDAPSYFPPPVPPAPLTNANGSPVWHQNPGPSHGGGQPYSRNYRDSRPQQPEPVRSFEDRTYDDQPPSRGSFRGGFRGRGRGDGWSEGHDRSKDWSQNRAVRRSRSRSPQSRYPSRREIKPYSPPRRPSLPQEPKDPIYSSTDEFGRDIIKRTASPVPPPEIVSTAPSMPVESTTAVADQHLLSSSIAANTSLAAAITTVTASKDRSEPGLESFNIATFDFTSPASWESLGNMWNVTNGEMPSMQQLMQFIASFGAPQLTAQPVGKAVPVYTAPVQQQQQQWSGWEGDQQQQWQKPSRGRGGHSQGRFGGRDNWNQGNGFETEAIVLGGGGGEEEAVSVPFNQLVDNDPSSGGSMQRIGDKWMFVRAPVAT